MPRRGRRARPLGVTPPGAHVRGIRYLRRRRSGGRRGSAPAPASGVRRTDPARRARRRAPRELGVEPVPGTRAARSSRTATAVAAAGLRARWLVAARRPALAAAPVAGAGPPGAGAAGRYGLRRHYPVAPWTDLVEVHWAEHAEAYVTPVGDGTGRRGRRSTVRRGAPYDELLAGFPALLGPAARRRAGDRGPGRGSAAPGRGALAVPGGCCWSATRPATWTR